MPVLVEGLSVIVRMEAIRRKYPGGWESFSNDAPNGALCSDKYLCRVGFMTPVDVKAFVQNLVALGLTFVQGKKAREIVVVDQLKGPTCACGWIDVFSSRLPGCEGVCKFARFKGDPSDFLAVPLGWTWESSITRNTNYIPAEELEKSMKFLRHENGVDVYQDLLTGEELYIGRTAPVLK